MTLQRTTCRFEAEAAADSDADSRVSHSCRVPIEASIRGLKDALARAGFDPPLAPDGSGEVDRVEEAIAPLGLPASLRTFWQQIDPLSVGAQPFPKLISPREAIDSWRRDRQIRADPKNWFLPMPTSLLLVGYQSWECMSVELHGPDASGGTLFEWRLDGGDFYLRYFDLAQWLDAIVSLLDAGAYERTADGRLSLNDPNGKIPLAAPRSLPPHPKYGTATSVPRDPGGWPPDWRPITSVDP